MTYTTKEISEFLDVPVQQMSIKLKRMGYKSCGFGANNMHIWEVDSLDNLKAKYENYRRLNSKETVSLATLAKKYEMSGALAYKILKNKGIYPRIDNHKNPIYLKEEAFSILDKIDRIDNSNHPLVTDKRCLNQNWWPDTNPSCFEGIDDD